MPGGLLSVALSSPHGDWALPSTLPCGARTFLPSAKSRGAAICPTPVYPI